MSPSNYFAYLVCPKVILSKNLFTSLESLRNEITVPFELVTLSKGNNPMTNSRLRATPLLKLR